MSPRLEGPGGRIVIDPEDLREVAIRLKGGAALLSGAGRELAQRSTPAMPPSLAAHVTETVCRANAALQDLAVELVRTAGELSARATWAELGGGEAIAWLIPNLYYLPASSERPLTPTSELPAVTDEQIRESTEWAVETLDGMYGSMQLLDDEATAVGSGVDDVFGAELIKFADEYADEIPVKALGKLTVLAGIALDTYEHRDEGMGEALSRAGVTAGGSWAGGALGVAFCEAVFGVTGVGLVGCLFVGGAGGGYIGDQVGEEVFD